MLRKLLKHEFRATGRIMLPLFALLMLTAAGANFAIDGLLDSSLNLLNVLGILLLLAFSIAMAAVCLVSFVLMIRRFYSSLLQDEGYIMLTLPVSVHQHIWSKLIVSTVWFAATVAVVIAACMIPIFNIAFVREVWSGAGEIFRVVIRNNHLADAANGALVCVECLIFLVAGSFAMCLRFYSAMAIGYSFSNHKGAMSVAAYAVSEVAMDILGTLGISLFNDSRLHWALLGWTDHISAMTGVHLSIWLLIGVAALYSAVFYGLTVYFLQKRLNLE